MRLVLIGPPGCGKGTQAKLLSERKGFLHFATGDSLRHAIETGTPEGQRAKPFIDKGQLVPDAVVNDIVYARFRGQDRPAHFVLDGYPRTESQAKSFEAVLKEQALDLTAVISLDVPDDEIVRRLSSRWTCPNSLCMAVYHAEFHPPKREGECDLCHAPLCQRDDDQPATVRKRLQVFHACHDELLNHYRRQGLLIHIAGHGDIESIYADIIKSLGESERQKLRTP